MVGTLLAALGVAASIQMTEPADGRALSETAKLSDAIALTRACPSLVIDRKSVAFALARAGISLRPLMPEIGRQSEAMALRYMTLDRRQACAIGRKLYGADGVIARGFLAER